MAWSVARPVTRLSDARSSYVIELAKYSAMLDQADAHPKHDDEDGTVLGCTSTFSIERSTSRNPLRTVGRWR